MRGGGWVGSVCAARNRRRGNGVAAAAAGGSPVGLFVPDHEEFSGPATIALVLNWEKI